MSKTINNAYLIIDKRTTAIHYLCSRCGRIIYDRNIKECPKCKAQIIGIFNTLV